MSRKETTPTRVKPMTRVEETRDALQRDWLRTQRVVVITTKIMEKAWNKALVDVSTPVLCISEVIETYEKAPIKFAKEMENYDIVLMDDPVPSSTNGIKLTKALLEYPIAQVNLDWGINDTRPWAKKLPAKNNSKTSIKFKPDQRRKMAADLIRKGSFGNVEKMVIVAPSDSLSQWKHYLGDTYATTSIKLVTPGALMPPDSESDNSDGDELADYIRKNQTILVDEDHTAQDENMLNRRLRNHHLKMEVIWLTSAVVQGKWDATFNPVESCVPRSMIGQKGKYRNPTKMPNPATVLAMFHYLYMVDPLPESETNRLATDYLLRNGMIEKCDGPYLHSNYQAYAVTTKGQHWIDTVMATPLPVSKTTWEIPAVKTTEEDDE